MSIVSSTYTVDTHDQVTGRRFVTEHHTDSVGVVHTVTYLAPVGADYQAIANARAEAIAEQIANEEAEALING
jgi:hypothetical protein